MTSGNQLLAFIVPAVLILGCGRAPKPAAVDLAAAPAAGTARVDAHGIDQVWVPPGSFLMGTPDGVELDPPHWALAELASEKPQHPVRLTTGFWIDTYEVTMAAYHEFVAAGGYETQALWSEEGWAWRTKRSDTEFPVSCLEDPAPDFPRVCVTWYEAEAYACWRGGRLPTEAEWEFAARGPESRTYPWGETWDPAKANVVESSHPVAVGSYPDGVSWVGAHDMSGNAMEWVQDWLDVNYYAVSPDVDPPGPATGRRKVEKGGWFGSFPYTSRAAYRHFEDPPTYQDHHIGFRVVTEAGP